MSEYVVTFWMSSDACPDVVTYTNPVGAVEDIQDARREGWRVEYTGDPFAAVAALASEED